VMWYAVLICAVAVITVRAYGYSCGWHVNPYPDFRSWERLVDANAL
jgi:hypothetical protein